MATVDRVSRSPAFVATSQAVDAEIEASIAGSSTYPEGTVFLPRELAGSALIAEYKRAHSPLAVVDEDGSIVLHRAVWPRPKEIAIGLVIAAALLWALSQWRAPTPSP